jgi:iron complex outermembrane receptor protein
MSGKPHVLGRTRLSVAVAAAIGSMASGVVTTRASAQEANSLEEIVVTGSRITRRDYTSNSPIVTIEAEQFEAQNGLNFEAYLNQLPNYNPAASPTVRAGAGGNGDVQITPVNSVGIASISLRGFGPNRNLVLMDGRRLVPINALMVTDINAIPSALIERVETITGGASAVYGADAVSGVTNFILRDDFEGFELDTQYGTTDAGDGAESRISAVFGANLSDGRGNVAVGVEAYNREAAYDIEREIFRERYNDPYAAGSFIFLQGTSHLNCMLNCPNENAIAAVFNAAPGTVYNPLGTVFRNFEFNSDGTIWSPGSPAGVANYNSASAFPQFHPYTAYDASQPGLGVEFQGLKYDNRQQLTSAPQKRYSFFASGDYDVSDRVNFFSRATLAESETETLLFGTNAIFGWETTVPYDPNVDSPLNPGLDYTNLAVMQAALANPTNPAYANPNFIPTGAPGAQHPVPVELAALLNSRTFFGLFPTPDADWLPGWNPDSSLPPRSTINTNSVWQIEAGLDFEISTNWTGELYLSHGQSSTYNNAYGNLSLERYRALTRAPDWGRNAVLEGNADGASPGFGTNPVACTSGFYNTFFGGDQPLSQDCFDAINAVLQTRAQNTQDILELNFQGSLGELPAGEVAMAAGYQLRENSATFVPDILQSTSSFTDQVVGVYPTGYMDAETEVSDYYAEFLIPVLQGKPGIERLELELGVRSSDYDSINETESTYKALINWQINDWFRLRGGTNRATRAPNIGELYLATQQVFLVGGNNFGDACGLRSTAPFGAGGTGPDPQLAPGEQQPQLAAGQTAAGAASARLICEAMMGPVAANQFYNVDNAAAGGGSPFNWVNQQGNAGLQSETADTLTFGFVMNSPFDRQWLSGLTLSFDWYKIEIDNAILLNSIDFTNYDCFGSVQVASAGEAAARAASPECLLVPRNQALGGPLTTAVSYTNQARIETSGADIGLNWAFPLDRLGGNLLLTTQATWLDYYRTKTSEASFDVNTDWVGTLGPNLESTNGGAYDYRLFGSLGYAADNWNVSLRFRYLPGAWTAEYASEQAIIANNARVAAGGSGTILSYTPGTGNTDSPEIKTDSYSVFDLAFNWDFTDSLSLRAGITNLFDDAPAESGSTSGYPAGTNFAAVCGGAPGCVAPTGPALRETGTFNGGYYDTLGRRYFVGLEVNF